MYLLVVVTDMYVRTYVQIRMYVQIHNIQICMYRYIRVCGYV